MARSDISQTFQISVETGPMAVRTLLDEVFAWLAPLALDVEERGTIELVLAEALNNIVEHAYPEPEARGTIDLTAEARRDGLHFRIEDDGQPMPDGHLPLGNAADLDVDAKDLPEGGFGWFLIRGLAKDVAYSRASGRNVLTLRLAISAAS
jgi:serine/threonine-protein kinase RsbW